MPYQEYDKIRELSNFGIYKGPISAGLGDSVGGDSPNEIAESDSAKENNTVPDLCAEAH